MEERTPRNSDDENDVFLIWYLNNACTSNVDVAVVSNVCRRWREVAVETIATEAVGLAKTADGGKTSPDDDVVASNTSESLVDLPSSQPPSVSLVKRLLITDMAREMVVRQHLEQQQRSNKASYADVIAKPTTQISKPRHLLPQSNNNTGENFCLAWFAPSGIQTVSVSLDDDSDITADEEDSPQKKGRGRKARTGKHVTCCSEWRGYRHATEVLVPFGYSEEFIRSVLDKSSNLANGNTVSTTTEPSLGSTISYPSSDGASQKKQTKIVSRLYNPTYAVRGATLARPEGICLCIDTDYIQHANSINFQKPVHAASHHVISRVEGWMNPSVHRNVVLSPIQRKQKQVHLEKMLLPRMVLSTRRKYPLLHRFAEEKNADEILTSQHLPWERRQRAVQFLNSDRSQAIKLITPPFESGPTHGPITIFIVAITTEDGCFLSGRSTRFEFGHLYPLSSLDMEFDMAPISIATGKKEVGEEGTDGATTNVGTFHRGSTGGTHATSSEDDDDDTSDSEQSVHCLCPFDSGDPFHPKDLSINDPSEDCIHRGGTGPGLWHCYTAVFDGKESLIRVDGCAEPKRTREHYGLASSDEEDDDDVDNPVNAGTFVGSGILDGLSIGSDHQFDMSLCYGEVEGECGQGAIAELAVFKGRMDDSDIKTLENYLMTKHGILSVQEKKAFVAKENSTRMKPMNIECHLQEDEWRRLSHAMIEQQRPWNVEGVVPLRVAANHPSVAWHRTNDITGSPVRISRIGAKNSNGSSDW